jgi:hypothetical protein
MVTRVAHPTHELTGNSLVVRSVDKISLGEEIRTIKVNSFRRTHTCVKVGIKELEGTLLIHGAHSIFMPLITDAHGTELQRRHPHTCKG